MDRENRQMLIMSAFAVVGLGFILAIATASILVIAGHTDRLQPFYEFVAPILGAAGVGLFLLIPMDILTKS